MQTCSMTSDLFTEAVRNNRHLHDLDASAIDLADRNLRGIQGENLNLKSANLRGAIFREAILRNCNLENVQAQTVCFCDARFEDSNADGGDFCKASLRRARLTATSFSRTLLREAVFDGAEGDAIDFRGSDLRCSRLRGVNFDEADFRGADLRGADLSGGRFHYADFRGAILEQTSFTNADCQGAQFDRNEGPAHEVNTGSDSNLASSVLSDLIGSLPSVVAESARPADFLDKAKNVIDSVASAAGYSEEQMQTLRENMEKSAVSGGVPADLVQNLISALQSDSEEPPEALKAWLEPLLRMESPDELLNTLRSATGRDIPPELRQTIEGIFRRKS